MNEVRNENNETAATRSASSMSSVEMERRIQELHQQVAALTDNLAKIGATKIDDYKSGVQKLANEAVAASFNALGAARNEAVSLEESVERRVRERPIQSLAIAVGVGFFAAILSRRG